MNIIEKDYCAECESELTETDNQRGYCNSCRIED